MKTRTIKRWGILHRKVNKLDGDRSWIYCQDCMPMMFHTRQAARDHIRDWLRVTYSRPDLKAEPHGWRMPKPVKIYIGVDYNENCNL